MNKMGKISYIVVPKHEAPGWRGGAKLSRRVIANAMRLLIAVLLMSALVAIIILAAHRAINDPTSESDTAQPVQPWTLAPVPSSLDSPPPVVLERQYILCDSEVPSGTFLGLAMEFDSMLKQWEKDLVLTALDAFQNCAIIQVRLEVGRGKQLQPNVLTSPSLWFQSRRCNSSKAGDDIGPELRAALYHQRFHVNVYSFDAQHLFHGTPFLFKWQDFSNPADPDDDLLDSCIRLMLVWRYGGIACNFREAGLLKEFVRVGASKGLGDHTDVILTKDTSVVYSRRPCHSAVGYMLLDYDRFFPLKSEAAGGVEEQLKNIADRADRIFSKSIHFITLDPDRDSSSELFGIAHSIKFQ